MRKPTEDALLALLQEERAALRTGDLTALPTFAARKLVLVEDIRVHPRNPHLIDRITRDLNRNAALLAAAMDGITTAQQRLGALRAVRNGLSVYTAGGDRQTVAQRPDTLERKA